MHIFRNHGQRRAVVEKSDEVKNLALFIGQSSTAIAENGSNIFRQVVEAPRRFQGHKVFLEKKKIALRIRKELTNDVVCKGNARLGGFTDSLDRVLRQGQKLHTVHFSYMETVETNC